MADNVRPVHVGILVGHWLTFGVAIPALSIGVALLWGALTPRGRDPSWYLALGHGQLFIVAVGLNAAVLRSIVAPRRQSKDLDPVLAGVAVLLAFVALVFFVQASLSALPADQAGGVVGASIVLWVCSVAISLATVLLAP